MYDMGMGGGYHHPYSVGGSGSGGHLHTRGDYSTYYPQDSLDRQKKGENCVSDEDDLLRECF